MGWLRGWIDDGSVTELLTAYCLQMGAIWDKLGGKRSCLESWWWDTHDACLVLVSVRYGGMRTTRLKRRTGRIDGTGLSKTWILLVVRMQLMSSKRDRNKRSVVSVWELCDGKWGYLRNVCHVAGVPFAKCQKNPPFQTIKLNWADFYSKIWHVWLHIPTHRNEDLGRVNAI